MGSQIRKPRPCVIVSPDQLNDSLRTVIIAPLTSGGRATRFRVAVEFQGRSGMILPDQIRAVDRRRPIKFLGRLDAPTLDRVLQLTARLFAP